MNHLSELIATMIGEQEGNISSMRSMIEAGADGVALGEAVVLIDAADVRIHSLAAVLGKFAAVKSPWANVEG